MQLKPRYKSGQKCEDFENKIYTPDIDRNIKCIQLFSASYDDVVCVNQFGEEVKLNLNSVICSLFKKLNLKVKESWFWSNSLNYKNDLSTGSFL